MERRNAILLFATLTIFLAGSVLFLTRDYAESAGMVGTKVCRLCHPDRYKSYAASIHGKKIVPGKPAAHDGCESCHGPGAAHVEHKGEKGVGISAFGKRISDAREKSGRWPAATKSSKLWHPGIWGATAGRMSPATAATASRLEGLQEITS